MARPHIEPYVETRTAFRRLTLPGFGRGLHYKTLSLDPDTGACSLVVKFESGWSRPPGFSYSEMELFVLDGELQCGDEHYGSGRYLWLPAGVSLPALKVSRGARALLYFNYGEPSFEESSQDHPAARRELAVNVDAYNDLQWKSGTKNPATAPGCMSKVLRIDPVSKGYTFLYCMTPNFWQDNISYHDCAEESYHIWGTSWMMQFGELPTGGYFWRPPYINHGAFASKLGCLALGRTDSELVNYFHFNPWTDIGDNKRRVAQKMVDEKPQLFEWTLSVDGHNHPSYSDAVSAGNNGLHVHYDAQGRVLTHQHAAPKKARSRRIRR